MAADTILICATARQAGWLQLHDAREALMRQGARPCGLGTGLWKLPNGSRIRFVLADQSSLMILRSAPQYSQVVLLYEADDLDEDWRYRLESILFSLHRQRNFHIVHFDELAQDVQRTWSRKSIEGYMPPDLCDAETWPRLPAPNIFPDNDRKH